MRGGGGVCVCVHVGVNCPFKRSVTHRDVLPSWLFHAACLCSCRWGCARTRALLSEAALAAVTANRLNGSGAAALCSEREEGTGGTGGESLSFFIFSSGLFGEPVATRLHG